MPCVQINGVERVAQMPFGIVIEAAAVEPFVTVGDGPFDDVVKDAIALMATFIANRFWGMAPPERFMAANSFFEHLGLVGGFLLVAWHDLKDQAARRLR